MADIIALLGNSHCKEMEFLNKKRFKRSSNKAKHFEATLEWIDGEVKTESLNSDSDLLQPERVRYLPQHYIEDLCNDIDTGSSAKFESELKKVIFSHVPIEERIQKATLDELIEFVVSNHKSSINQLRGKVQAANKEITEIEHEISEENIREYKNTLQLVDGGEKARKYGGQISGMQWSNKNGRSCLPFLLLH